MSSLLRQRMRSKAHERRFFYVGKKSLIQCPGKISMYQLQGGEIGAEHPHISKYQYQ